MIILIFSLDQRGRSKRLEPRSAVRKLPSSQDTAPPRQSHAAKQGLHPRRTRNHRFSHPPRRHTYIPAGPTQSRDRRRRNRRGRNCRRRQDVNRHYTPAQRLHPPVQRPSSFLLSPTPTPSTPTLPHPQRLRPHAPRACSTRLAPGPRWWTTSGPPRCGRPRAHRRRTARNRIRTHVRSRTHSRSHTPRASGRGESG